MKHKTVYFSEKCTTILSHHSNRETSTKLAHEFNVGKLIITDLIENGTKIHSYASVSEESTNKRQAMLTSNYPLLDEAAYHTLSGPIFKETAKLFKIIKFKMNDDWLDKFKKILYLLPWHGTLWQ